MAGRLLNHAGSDQSVGFAETRAERRSRHCRSIRVDFDLQYAAIALRPLERIRHLLSVFEPVRRQLLASAFDVHVNLPANCFACSEAGQHSCSDAARAHMEAPVKHPATRSPSRGFAALDARRNQPARFARAATPSETLNNIVHLIQQRFETDVCSVYLLEAGPREPGARGDDRAAPGERRPRADAAHAKAWRAWSPSSCGRRSSPTPRSTRASSTFREAGEDPYRSFLGVPIIDRGLLQGVLVVQTIEPRTFAQDDVRHAGHGRRAARADRQRGAHARAVRRAGAPAAGALAQNLWWSWDDGRRPACSASSIPRCGASCDHNPIALLAADSDRHSSRSAPRQLALHSRINYAYRRMQEYLNSTHTWGARHAGVLWARPVAYFSAEFGLHESMPIYSGGLGILAGDHIKSASDLGIPLVGVGLYYDQGYFRQRLDANGWQHEDYLDVDSRSLPLRAGAQRRRPDHRLDRDAHRRDRRARLAAGRRPQHAAAARLERRGQQPGGPRADGAALRRRRPRADPSGAAARRRRRAGAGRARHLAGRRAPERRAQRVRRAGVGPAAHARGRHRRVDEAIRRVAPHVVFTTHTPVPAGHDRFSRATDRRTPRAAARRARHRSPISFMALGRVEPRRQPRERSA